MKASKIEIVAKEIQLLRSEDFDTVYFHGETMMPFLKEADELIVTPIDVSEIKPGDIVTYLDDDKFPTRRVIRNLKTKSCFLIQGDSIPKRKYVVPYNLVIGIAVARKRKGKWIYSNRLAWKWARFWVIKRERLKYKTKKIKRLGIIKTLTRFF